jgi:hypothetical protein
MILPADVLPAIAARLLQHASAEVTVATGVRDGATAH